ncbi:MAG: CotH kinase family protein [Kiritimatiellia bacterium]
MSAHESGGGFCVTGGKNWLITEGVTIILKYTGLPSTGDQALVTLAQSNDGNQLSKVGIGTSNGVLKGIWEGNLWNGGETTGKTLPESGTLVFVYYPDASTRGVFTYDAEGTELFKAKGLEANGTGATLGAQFDLGSNHAGSLSTEGFAIEAVEIRKGAVGSDEVAAVLADFEKTEAAQAFVSEVGKSASGWFSDWSGEKNGGVCKVVGREGAVVTARKIDGSVSYHPYISDSEFPAKEKVLLSIYGTTDFMPTPAAGKLAVLWNFGRKDNCNALALDENRHLVFVHSAGTTVSKRIDAGEAPKGYHLYSVVFDKDNGCGVYIDANAGVYDATFTSVPSGGWQVGSIYGGGNNLYVKGDGFVPLNIWASEEAYMPMIDQLAETYPAVTAIAKTFAIDAYGETVYLPSLTVPNRYQLRVLRGTLAVPASVEATLGGLEFGDVNTGNLGFGLELDGTINIVNDRTFTGNDATQAYNACNEGRGVNFGEWAGEGVITIRGTFNAPDTVVEVVHDSSKVTVNVDGGMLNVKGIAAKNPSRATINLTNGGTISYGTYPSCPGVVKNYGPGTVTGTSNWTDPDSFTISGTAESPTVFAADGVTLKFTGDITVAGAYRIDTANDGVVELHVMVVDVDGVLYDSLDEIASALRPGSTVTIQSGVTKEEIEALGGVTLTDNGEGGYTAALAMASEPVLRFSEIMPKPSDKPNESTTQAGYDRNGLESGWVELENTSDKWVDLGDYKFCRANRGKVYTHADYGNFPSGTYIPPHGRFTFYTSERYSNSYPEAKDGNTSAFATGTFDGKPIWYDEMLIWGDKVNPKKFPYVTLVYRPAEATADTILETVIIPSDTPEGYSIIVGHDAAENAATERWLCPSPTFNAANTDTAGLVKIGPNVGPAYGTKHSATEFGPTAPAKPGVAYVVTMNVNPIYHASGTRTGDAITSVTLVYRTKLGEGVSGEVTMEKTGTNDGGDVWTATIPANAIPSEPGQLIQWKTKITDGANNTWTSPSFMNKDDGYEWFGTITEPGELNSTKLPTWHLFVDALSLKWMDTDADDQSPTEIPNQARVAIYDSSTSNYYDYVRIDLRGNTSANFAKKSHGLRFSKVHPLTMKDAVRGGTVKEIRKSSLIGEPADPSFMRQMVAFWLWDRMGNKVPFDFPVRCNLNGAFYQLAFHSERFTDELIEDVYGFDKYGYGYKNVGTLKSGSGTTAGGIEKKTPDDGNESDISVLQNDLRQPLADLGIDDIGASDNAERPAITKFVVEKFDLPAWLNYLASARITQEMDDVWANISMYKDDAEMLEGTRGTGTWMPLGYDFNLTFGQWYYNDVGSGSGLMANQDWFKSHPFYGGNVVRCYKQAERTTTCNEGNRGIEAVWQSPKFRRLYLRRLRTLMDQELKAPGTVEADVPFMAKMRELAELMAADAVLDQEKWPHSSSNTGAIDVWRGGTAWPETMAAGIDDIWNNYVVPRQTHLYVTHAVTNDTMMVGYGSSFNAGIPDAQASLDVLKEGLSAAAVEGGVVIRNTNAEAIDLSGWDVSGPVVMKLPAGTVIDQAIDGTAGELFVVTDRKAYVAANKATLTDQVIVGNAKVGSGTDIGLTAADGTVVLSADVILSPGTYTDESYDVPVRLAPAGAFTFQGVKFNGGVTLGEGTFTLKNQNGYTNTAAVVEASAANIVFTGKGAFELVGTAETVDPLMTVGDLYVSNGVFSVESKATTAGVKAVVVAGDFVVEDKGTVSVKLSKKTVSGVAISQELKNKVCRIGTGGTFVATVNGAGGSALRSEKGTVELTVREGATVRAEGVGENARFFKMDGNMRIEGGMVDLCATGRGAELVSSGKTVFISGGDLHLESTDDCVSATTAIEVSGGTIVGSSTENDVLDSNGTITISGGTLVLLATAEGHEGLDSDPNPPDEVVHSITITGGIVYSLGGANCDLRLPDAGGQAYATRATDDAAGYVSVAAGETVHWFTKPAGGCMVLVSVPGMTGVPVEAAAWPEDAEVVLEGCYATSTAESVLEVVPGGVSVTVTAATAEEAAAQVTVRAEVPEAAAGAVTPKDYAAYFKAEATPAEGASGAFTVTAVLNPETVPAPEIGVVDGRTAPLFVEADSDGQALVVGVVNAKPGLWYGLAASSELQETSFADDLPSFVLATSPTEQLTLTASPRVDAAAFFRVRVVIAAPTPSSHPTPTP